MNCTTPDYTENYKGLTIKIYQDPSPQNPWKDWDGNPPIAIYADRSIHTYGEKNGDPNEAPTLTKAQIKANLPAIKELLNVKTLWKLREYIDDYSGDFRHSTEAMNEWIRETVDYLGNSDRLEALETLFNMAGVPALLKTVRGYSQGDWAEVLAISTPAFEKEIGTSWTTKELEGSIRLYGDWAFGNVYGYVVEDADGKHVDSCWGFYGDYDAEYSALSEAKSHIDWYVENERKEHIAQLKAWIKNRVPYQYRHFCV